MQTTKFFAPETVDMIRTRALAGSPGLRAGDIVNYLIQFTPIENNATVGAGGYITDYIPTGAEVVGAWFVEPDGSGGYAPTVPALPGPMPGGWGTRGAGSYPNFATTNATHNTICSSFGRTVLNCNGSLSMVYADTGIFYSTDPRTVVFVAPSLDGRVRQGTNGYNIAPTAANQLNPLLNQAQATTHNLWDASCTNAFGSTQGNINGAPNPKSATVDMTNGRGQGVAPFFTGSPVAGPGTGYQLDYTGTVGPWQRIAYPGSRIGDPAAGPATSANGSGGQAGSLTEIAGSATSLGRGISVANPLPAGTNAVRWAAGTLVVGELKYVKVSIRLTTDPPMVGFINNSEVFGGDSAQAAGKTGNDNPWRYHVPSVADNHSHLFVRKSIVAVNGQPSDGSSIPANALLRYRVEYVNGGNADLTNLQLRDVLPSQTANCSVTNLVVVSGPNVLPITPACPPGGGAFTFQLIPFLGPGQGGIIEYDVQTNAANGNLVANKLEASADQVSPAVTSFAVTTVLNTALLQLSKTVTPDRAGPGDTVSYTITVRNTGQGNATNIVVYDALPGTPLPLDATTRFNYVPGSSTFSGITAVVPTTVAPPTLPIFAGQNREEVRWTFAAQFLPARASFTITFDAVIGANVPQTSVPYGNGIAATYTAGGTALERTILTTAPVVVAPDTDMDGIDDPREIEAGTDPFDSDTDDDGVLDGAEVDWNLDTDGDGLINALDPDSDDDGLTDGVEMGVTYQGPGIDRDGDGTPDDIDPDPLDPAIKGTDLASGNYREDADTMNALTSMVNPDSDGDGGRDGCEDANWDGRQDAGESDPADAMSNAACRDTDMDGIPDLAELDMGTDPFDADTDDDGVWDGAEANAGFDTDGDGLINALDPDSDDDGITDGTEEGVTYSGPGTDTDMDGTPDDIDPDPADPTIKGTDIASRNFRPDADPANTTSMVNPDTDGDGGSDGCEDPNHDGAVTAGETEGWNALSVSNCTDTDGDGLTDEEEDHLGSDPLDADTDDDGVLDGDENNLSMDTDGDGLINVLDPDSDADGLNDGTERGVQHLGPATDSDMDGTPDDIDPDPNDPTIKGTDVNSPDYIEDQDPSDTTFMVNPDSDGDGCGDGQEDANQNGRIDAMEADPNDPSDIPPTCADLDSDGDTIPDSIDEDDDNDGIPDVDEGPGDTDMDGIPDRLDLDSDNDGIPDVDEAGGIDVDRDGRIDGFVDLDMDGLADSVDPTQGGTPLRDPDTDMDGIPDRQDLDSDNDGVPDVIEAGGPDADRDGRIDGFVDADGDGLADSVDPTQGGTPLRDPDSDNDGTPDRVDLDSDNDGVPDVIESGGPDADRDGRIDGFVDGDGDGYADFVDPDRGGTPLPDPDSDGDGVRDAVDLDSDNDGITDVREAGGPDVDGDGRIDGFVDADGDGLADSVDPDAGGTPLPDPDSDGDGVRDVLDLDSDNDGIPDAREAGGPLGFGPDADGDGRIDGFTDADGDGLADSVDPDQGGTPLVVQDADMDGRPDGIDVDADGDGITDATEAGADGDPNPDADGDGRIDGFTDADGDGLADSVDPDQGGTPLPVPDTDRDGRHDWRDLDTDGDGLPDLIEGFDPDVPRLGRDTDGDGLDDAFDPDQNGTPANLPDFDSDGTPDWREPEAPNMLRNDELTALDFAQHRGVFVTAFPLGTSLDWFGPDGIPDAGEGGNEQGNGSGDDDDFYVDRIASGWLDPDPTVARDPSRPLVFYELSCSSCILRLVIDPATRSIRATY